MCVTLSTNTPPNSSPQIQNEHTQKKNQTPKHKNKNKNKKKMYELSPMISLQSAKICTPLALSLESLGANPTFSAMYGTTAVVWDIKNSPCYFMCCYYIL